MPEAARKGIGMRVLLIEDDSATAQSIELMLKSESFNVYTTDLGEEGVDLGKLYDYDIILLDLNLPDLSGYEVLRSLRVAKVKTPILILSGLAAMEGSVAKLAFRACGHPEALGILIPTFGLHLQKPNFATEPGQVPGWRHMSEPGHGKRALPDAWRQEYRAANGGGLGA